MESWGKPTVYQGLSRAFLSHLVTSKRDGQNILLLNKLYFTLIKHSFFQMPHLSQMEIKWRKYVFFLLLDQIAFNGSNTEWIYSCNLCGTLNTHRPSMYFHLETCHSTPRILDYILSLEFKASKHEIVQYFCDDHNTNISMQ